MTAGGPGSVFVTGALGFVGRAVLERYRDRGARVGGVDLRADPDLGVVAGDVREPGDWQRAAAGFDLVVHTAAAVTNTGSLDGVWRLNVLAVRRALDAAVAGGARRFLHLSSVRAFSDTLFPDGVDERWPVRTQGRPYVDTKVASEQVVLQAHAAGEVDCTIVRPGDVYGPRSRPWTVIPVELIRARRFVLPARGRGIFSPVYVDDLVDGIAAAAQTPAAAGRVLTITGGVGVTTREFFGNYAHMLGRRPPPCLPTPVVMAFARAESAVARARGRETEVNPISVDYLTRTGTYSIAAARETIGYQPQVGLAEGMRRTESWLRAEGLI